MLNSTYLMCLLLLMQGDIRYHHERKIRTYTDYLFTEEDAKNVILSLTVYDFSGAVQNDHPQHPEEILYIFGKDISLMPRFGGSEETVSPYIKFNKLTNQYVIVISLHKQEYPLTYKFK